MLVAELADGIAGYVKLGQALPIAASRHVLEIKGLAVSPAHRRRGVGRALLHAAIGAARERRRPQAHPARARPQHAPPAPSTPRCGFEIEGVLRGFFCLDGRYVDDVLMALDLTADGS